jgi:hypothetical protein
MRHSETKTCISAAQHSIGEKLRAHYGPLITEPVPEQFVELLHRLDATPRDAAVDRPDK